MTLRTPNQVVLSALRDEVLALLERCTDEQKEFFWRIFPNGLDALSEGKLKDAILLCQRTIRKNEAAVPGVSA